MIARTVLWFIGLAILTGVTAFAGYRLTAWLKAHTQVDDPGFTAGIIITGFYLLLLTAFVIASATQPPQ